MHKAEPYAAGSLMQDKLRWGVRKTVEKMDRTLRKKGTRIASSAVAVSGTSAFVRKSFGTAPLVAPGDTNPGFTSAGKLPNSSKVRG